MTQGKTYGYLRVSSQDQKENGHSIKMQEDRIRHYCKYQGFPEPEIFSDAGISGRSTKNRIAFLDMMDAAKKGDNIIVYSVARFGRNLEDILVAVNRLKKKGADFHSLNEGIDTSKAHSVVLLALAGAIAENTSEEMGRQISSVHQHRKSQKKTYAKLITGYKNVYDITQDGKRTNGRLEPTEHLNTVKTIFELNSKGKGAYAIASILNKKGIKPPQGKQFYQSSVLSILNNQIHANT